MPENLWFYLAFSSLLAHELDAIHKQEWRLLYFLRTLPEVTARRAFVFAHIPLFALLLWLLANPVDTVRCWTMLGMDAFMVVHAGMHVRLEKHIEYKFKTIHSRGLIYGTALLALIHIGIFWIVR